MESRIYFLKRLGQRHQIADAAALTVQEPCFFWVSSPDCAPEQESKQAHHFEAEPIDRPSCDCRSSRGLVTRATTGGRAATLLPSCLQISTIRITGASRACRDRSWTCS